MTQRTNRILSSLFLLVILTFSCNHALSQSFTTPIPWHHTVFEARAAALGQSTAALNNGTSYHPNPAIPSESGVIHASSFLLSATPYYIPQNGADLYSPGISFSAGKFAYTAMVDYTTHTPPATLGTIVGTYSNRLLRFRTGYQINDKLSVGAGILHSSYKSPEFSSGNMEFGGDASGWGIDLGLFYRNQFESDKFHLTPQAGLSLNTIGPGFEYEQRDMPDGNLPGQIRLGVGIDVKTKRNVHGKSLFGAGIYSGFSKYLARQEYGDERTVQSQPGGFEALFTTWNSFKRFSGSQNEVITLGEQISGSVGLELQFLESLYLRYGILGGADDWVRPQNGIGVEADFYYVSLAVTHLNYHSSDRWTPQDNSTYAQISFRIPLDGETRDTLIGRLFNHYSE